MHEIENGDEATRCPRCGGRAFQWRTITRPAREAPAGRPRAEEPDRPSWTCMHCGWIDPRADGPDGPPPHG